MLKKAVEKPKRQKVVQPVVGDAIQANSGPPQFLIDATDANNIGEYDKAIDYLKQGIGQDSFAAYKGIGDIYLSLGRSKEAMEWLKKARDCMPQSVEVIGKMGQVLVSLGREEEAVEIFSTTIRQQEEMAKVHVLVNSMWQTGLTDKAIKILEGMIEVNPQRSEIVFELAWLLQRIGRLDKAEVWYKRHLELKPTYVAHNHLGLLCRDMGRISEAVEHFRKTVELHPLFGGGWDNLACALMESGHIEESIELSRIIVADTPNVSTLHSNFLLRLHYSQSLDPQALFEEHIKWGQKYAPISMAKASHSNTVDPGRKLRIGYISPDFAKHVSACYIAVLLGSHNRDAVEVYGYGNVESPDQVTCNLQDKFDQYRDIWEVGDEAVARIIEQDRIDILVELAGHTKNNRLRVLAYKPAPVQVTYLGYADTTGMEAIDYLLTDNIVTPPTVQNFYTEELFPLPSGLFCYKPLEEAPAIKPLSAAKQGYVTFGAFTSVGRLNTRVLRAWANILKQTPNARLVLGFRGGDDEKLQHDFLSQFEQWGISRERIEVHGLRSYHKYLKQYNGVDIVLDTFPENGGTTTCDALWMGVPVISLVGDHQVGRYGLSLLSSIGLERFVATTTSEYVAKAVALAADPESRTEMRGSMRQHMAESPLCDSKQFTHELESAYREMWHRWCEKQGVSVQKGLNVEQPPVGDPNPSKTGPPRFAIHAHDATGAKETDTIQIAIAEDMPQFLVDANAAIMRGQIEQAKGLVNDQAIEEVRQRLESDPSRTDIMFMVATILSKIGQKRMAYAWYEKHAELEPDALVYYQMALINASQGLLAECIDHLYKAMKLAPDVPQIWVTLAGKLLQRKQLNEGFDLLRKAIQKAPDNPVFYSVYLFNLNHLPDVDPQMVFDLHKQWGKLHAPISLARTSHDNDPVADRRLRIGYISPDFCASSVSHFFEPLLGGHNRNEVEVFGYGNVMSPDLLTERQKRKCDHYRNICGIDDETVAQMIEQDRIDILVELSGHTQNNRLLVLARKPAPIQATYLGYADTTGMEAIDYILTNKLLSPPESQKFYTEQLMYLPDVYHCYKCPEMDVALAPPPAIENGYVTFGALTPHRRFNLSLLKLWADILQRTPNSRIALGFASDVDDSTQNHYLNEFDKCGISRERVSISGRRPYVEYLKEHNKIDILLDTHPENGGTYTCESLWMGVPVITLAGPRQISRYGLSILSHVGLDRFVATTTSDYIAKAVALANDPESLIELRKSMRSKITNSPLCNTRQFIHELETIYRKMWHQWCRSQGVSVPTKVPARCHSPGAASVH